MQLSRNATEVIKKRYLAKNKDGKVIETAEDMFTRVARTMAGAERDESIAEYEEKFYKIMTNLEFLPNSPTLINAGRELGQLSACFVLPLEDSMDSIFTTLRDAALIQKSGGGCGFSFSNLRPANDLVKSTNKCAGGPVAFIRIFDQALDVIRQGGVRHGANMAVMRCLSGDTQIKTPTGNISIKKLVGKNPYLYCTDGKTLYMRQAKSVFSNGKRKLLRVVFDDHSYVDCTSDHLFLLKNSMYKEASKLLRGDSLLRMQRYLYKCTSDRQWYPFVTLCGIQKRYPEHRLLAEAVYKRKLTFMEDVHHKDNNPCNNTPENLEVLSRQEHAKITGQNCNFQQAGRDFIKNRLYELPEYKERHKRAINHKVIDVIELNVEEEVFDISMDEFHNFALANDTFVHNCDHPDITSFIQCKQEEGSIPNFNISVGITDEFMSAVKADRKYQLINPRSGAVVEEVRANDIFNLIIEHAHANGEPGLLFLDEMNRHNPTPHMGMIEATNPCGEQPLLGYESCNLGSINLGRMVKAEKMDWDRLKYVTQIAVRFLDNVIDMNRYPISAIETKTKATRKIGLGVMGFADMLIKLGIEYNTDEAIKIAREVMRFIHVNAIRTSTELAKTRGVFPAYRGSTWQTDHGVRVRNAALTTVAPTGTLSIIANCSSGIEPYYSKSIKKHILNTILEEEIEYAKSDSFITAHEIAPEWHVKIQSAFQPYIDSAVSKTINFPNEATKEDVRYAYLLAYKLKCKGITVFRDGSRSEQVLTDASNGKTNDKCPSCGADIIVAEGCKTCSNKCGWSACAVA